MDYVQAFEKEIAAESLVDDISKKVSSLFKFLGNLIQKAIRFIKGLLGKIMKKRNSTATNQNPTPNNQEAGQSDVLKQSNKPLKNEDLTVSETDSYDCGNELSAVIEDLKFAIQLIQKRPKPDHKVGKGYSERWEQDNSLIADRMERCLDTIKKLESIKNKTVSLETGTKLKDELEKLNEEYERYGRVYDMFVRQHNHAIEYMKSTINSIQLICTVGNQALVMITDSLSTPD